MKKYILLISAVLCMMASCKKDETIIYGETTYVNVYDGRFITDNGNEYIIERQSCDGKLDTMKRALIYCDVLSKSSDKVYRISLMQITVPVCKDILHSSRIPADSLGKDPISVNAAWTSGGYINITATIPFLKGDKAHLLDLELVDSLSNADTMVLNLRHDASGDIDTVSTDANRFSYAHMTLPIQKYFPEGRTEPIFLDIRWYWYTAMDKSKKDVFHTRGPWSGGGFIQPALQ